MFWWAASSERGWGGGPNAMAHTMKTVSYTTVCTWQTDADPGCPCPECVHDRDVQQAMFDAIYVNRGSA